MNTAEQQRAGMRHKFEEIVEDVAMDCIGGWENYISDNGLAEKAASYTREEVAGWALDDIRDECPREVRFLGNERIYEIACEVADTFEYRGW